MKKYYFYEIPEDFNEWEKLLEVLFSTEEWLFEARIHPKGNTLFPDIEMKKDPFLSYSLVFIPEGAGKKNLFSYTSVLSDTTSNSFIKLFIKKRTGNFMIFPNIGVDIYLNTVELPIKKDRVLGFWHDEYNGTTFKDIYPTIKKFKKQFNWRCFDQLNNYSILSYQEENREAQTLKGFPL